MGTAYNQLWAEALANFHSTTGKKLDDTSLPKLASLDDLKVELNKRQEDFAEFRSKRHALVCPRSK